MITRKIQILRQLFFVYLLCLTALLCSAAAAAAQADGMPGRGGMEGGIGLGTCLWQEGDFLRVYERDYTLPWGWGRCQYGQPLVMGDVLIPNTSNFRTGASESYPDRMVYAIAGEMNEEDEFCPDLKRGDELCATVTVSRLAPALLFDLQGTRKIDVFAGDKTERWMHKGASRGWVAGEVSTKWKLFDQAYPYSPPVKLEMPGAPDKFAASDGKTVVTGLLPGEPSGLVDGELEWLLLWYGEDASWFLFDAKTRGDKAYLLVFSEPPEISVVGGVFDPASGRQSGKGPESAVRIEFMAPGGQMVMMPFPAYGFMRGEDTGDWVKSLPDKVRSQCDWWAKRLLEYPLAANESFAYDAEKDELAIRVEFEYQTLRAGGARFAPVPPMLETARINGFPITVSGETIDTGARFYCGPCSGIDNASGYESIVKGMGRYARERRSLEPGGQAQEPARKALAELEREIDAMLDAGHLAPVNLPFKSAWGWNAFNLSSARLLYSAPGQTLRVLAEACPLLDDARRARVREYMIKERTAYPPETVAHLPTLEGAWREKWILTEEWRIAQSDVSRKQNFHVLNNVVPAEALYDLAAYYQAAGAERMAEEKFDLRDAMKLTVAPWMAREDWPTVGWRMWAGRDPAWWASYGWNLDPDVNRLVAAYIGMSRLAAMAGDAAHEHEGIYRMAKALIHRHARGFYPPRRDGPAMNDRGATSLIMSQWFTDAAGPFTAMPPELGRFLADHCRPEMEAYARDLAEYYPDIYMAFGTGRYSTEWWHNYPEDSRQAFMLNAWVLGRDAGWLYERVDVPWMKVGDLFHIEKLSEIVKAGAGGKWEK